jgi:hypothetical protein
LGTWVQHFEIDAVPAPVLTRDAASGLAYHLQLVIVFDRTQQLGLRLHRQHRQCAAGVIGVAVA